MFYYAVLYANNEYEAIECSRIEFGATHILFYTSIPGENSVIQSAVKASSIESLEWISRKEYDRIKEAKKTTNRYVNGPNTFNVTLDSDTIKESPLTAEDYVESFKEVWDGFKRRPEQGSSTNPYAELAELSRNIRKLWEEAKDRAKKAQEETEKDE